MSYSMHPPVRSLRQRILAGLTQAGLAMGIFLLAALTGDDAAAQAAATRNFPAPQTGVFVAKDFRFSTGEVFPELKLAYTTVGAPTGEPVLIIHGTGGSAANMLTPAFAGELFGPGAPLDATKHFIVIPDVLGTGQSSKPSDGLRMNFPKYGYEDMVRAQHLLVTQHLGIKKLKLVMGNSMGGMHTWMWGYMYPDMMTHLAPMAATPAEVAGRNWVTRRIMIDIIKMDPGFNNGNYTEQPKSLALAMVNFQASTSGGNMGWHQMAPTREKGDEFWTRAMAQRPTVDANNFIYQFDASRDFKPAPHLEKIQARLLAINAADDERNPPEFGVMERELKRLKDGKVYWIPGTPDTRGHGTTGNARWYKQQLGDFLAGK